MSDALKKRKSKVLRSEGGTPETKRGRGEGDQQVRVKHSCAVVQLYNYKYNCQIVKSRSRIYLLQLLMLCNKPTADAIITVVLQNIC